MRIRCPWVNFLLVLSCERHWELIALVIKLVTERPVWYFIVGQSPPPKMVLCIYAITASVARPFFDTLFSWSEIPNRICHGRHIEHCHEPSNINGINEKRVVLPCHRFGTPSRIPYSIVRRLSTAPSLKVIIKYMSDEAEARDMDFGPVLFYVR